MLPHDTVIRSQGQAGFKEGPCGKGQFAAQHKIFSGYLASCQSKCKAYEAAHLVKSDPGSQLDVLIDQGKDVQILSDAVTS